MFWDLTPKDIDIDFKAFKKRREMEIQMSWVSGNYFKRALESTVLICGLADRRAINNMPKYPEIPKSEEEIISEEAEQNRTDYHLAKMRNWQAVNNMIQRQNRK